MYEFQEIVHFLTAASKYVSAIDAHNSISLNQIWPNSCQRYNRELMSARHRFLYAVICSERSFRHIFSQNSLLEWHYTHLMYSSIQITTGAGLLYSLFGTAEYHFPCPLSYSKLNLGLKFLDGFEKLSFSISYVILCSFIAGYLVLRLAFRIYCPSSAFWKLGQ